MSETQQNLDSCGVCWTALSAASCWATVGKIGGWGNEVDKTEETPNICELEGEDWSLALESWGLRFPLRMGVPKKQACSKEVCSDNVLTFFSCEFPSERVMSSGVRQMKKLCPEAVFLDSEPATIVKHQSEFISRGRLIHSRARDVTLGPDVPI